MSQYPAGRSASSLSREDLKTIASHQKVILICIGVYLAAVVGQFLIPTEVRPLLGLAVMGLGVAAAVFIFMLAIKLYGTGLGIVLGILTLIPLIGLIVLLIVNGKATSTLRAHGIAVGLMGAQGPIA